MVAFMTIENMPNLRVLPSALARAAHGAGADAHFRQSLRIQQLVCIGSRYRHLLLGPSRQTSKNSFHSFSGHHASRRPVSTSICNARLLLCTRWDIPAEGIIIEISAAVWCWIQSSVCRMAFKASLFHTTPKKNHSIREEPLPATQIGRAPQELGIDWIGVHSPRAKGRVERSTTPPLNCR